MSTKQQNTSVSSKQHMRELAKVRRHVDTLVRGRVFTPSGLPPNVVGQPWTRMTAIDVDRVKDKTYTLKDLAGVICSQAGLFSRSGDTDTPIPVEFKIISIACWTGDTHISLYPQDFLSGDKVELQRIDGSSARNQWARAGYVYPATFQNLTLSSNNASQMAQHFYTVNCAAAARLETHVTVLWRSANTKVVSLGYSYRDALHCLQRRQGDTGAAIEIDIHQRDRADREDPGSDAPSIEDVYSEVRALREQLRNLKPT